MRLQEFHRVCFLVLALPAVLPAAAQPEGLPAPVAAVLANHRLSVDHVSVFVQAVDADEPLLAVNPQVLRNPASITKLLITYAALDSLGPGYRWHTEAWATGPLRGGRLDGDLVLRGGGDPGLVTERYWMMLRELRARGIEEISGRLVIDDTLFAPNGEAPGDFDRQPYRAYNVLPSAILVSHNAVEFRVLRDGSRVRVHMDPPLHDFRIENRINTRQGQCGGFQRGVAIDLPEGLEGRRAVLSGAFPSGCTEHSLYRAVLPAPQFADALFRALWMQLGGRVHGELELASLPEDAELIYRHPSLPLNEQIRAANKWSHNAMTRHLLLTMGIERSGPPGTLEKGREALAEWLVGRGLDVPGYFVDNGSGLSRDTLFSAEGFGRMLLDAWAHPQMPELVSSMPLSAVDGTLRQRYNDRMAGHLYLKTGRLEGVSSVAGYLQNRAGRRYVVVVIVNHPDAHRGPGILIQDAVLRWVFEYHQGRG